MSQRNLKYTVCSSSHYQLHYTFICKSCGGTSVSANEKLSTANWDQTSANKTLKPRTVIPSVTRKNSRSCMTAYWKTTKKLTHAFQNQEKKWNTLHSSWRKRRKSTKTANDAEELANLMMLEDAEEKTHCGQQTHCKLKTGASVSAQQFFSQRTAASKPITTRIDPRQ